MSKLSLPLPLTSLILGCNLLILAPVLGQANFADIPLPDLQTTTTANLLENNEATDRVITLAETSDVMVASTAESNATNESLRPLSATTFNSNNFGEESQDLSVSNIQPSNVLPTPLGKEEGYVPPFLSPIEGEEVRGDRVISLDLNDDFK